METIFFHNHGIDPGLRNKKLLKTLLLSIFRKEHLRPERISYIFCKDDYLLALNKKYLRHDFLTDVLTFTLSDPGVPVVSEIYISVERVKENALFLKTIYTQELLRVMIHGILHLCGYEDNTVKQLDVIRKKEDYYLSRLPFHVKRST